MTQVTDRGQRAEAPPPLPSPIITLFLSPSTSADSQRGPFVLALSTVCRRDESLAEFKQTYLRNPGLQASLPLIPFLN